MVIWSHADAGYLHYFLLFALFFLVPPVMLIQYLHKIYIPALRGAEKRRLLTGAVLSVPIVILLVLQLFSLSIPANLLSFFRAEKHVLQGPVEIVSCTEDWGRSFNGYDLVLTVDGETFAPLDAFPAELVEQLQEGSEFRITYVHPKNDGIYTWQIETIP